MKKPPKCPECGKYLNIVIVGEHFNYKFDERNGVYIETPSDYTANCFHCNANILYLFEDGVCNYKVKDDEEGKNISGIGNTRD